MGIGVNMAFALVLVVGVTSAASAHVYKCSARVIMAFLRLNQWSSFQHYKSNSIKLQIQCLINSGAVPECN